MPISVCPAAVVAAPVEKVWEVLMQPSSYDKWLDMHTILIEPEGPAVAGQTIHAWTRAFGKKWDVSPSITLVNAEKHQIGFDVKLPLGVMEQTTMTCTPIDATSCQVRFG
jgi:uncharacterized protein YndB with AHSA1/START domain